MDLSRFDTLVQGLVSHASRRAVLAAVGRRLLTGGGAGAMAALVAGLPAEPTLADCRRRCRRKNTKRAQRRCRKRCGDQNDLQNFWLCDTDRKRCFNDDPADPVCAVCLGSRQEQLYNRFLSCYRNKSFCGNRAKSCCEFCAGWAGDPDDCACCS